MKTQDKSPSLIDGLSIEDILAPVSVPVVINGHTVNVFPMQDAAAMKVTESIEQIVRCIQDSVGFTDEGLDMASVVAIAPSIIRQALPAATDVIAASLGVSPEVVSRTSKADRVLLLQGVLQAENIPQLLKNVEGLLSIFRGVQSNPASSQTEPQSEVGTENSTAKME